METQQLSEPALVATGHPDPISSLLDDKDDEAPLEDGTGNVLAATNRIKRDNSAGQSSVSALAGCVPRLPLKQAELLPAPISSGVNQIVQTAQASQPLQPPTPKRGSQVVHCPSKSHSSQAARPRPLSISSVPKPSLIPSITTVNAIVKPSSASKPAKNNSRRTTPSTQSQSGPRTLTTPTPPRVPIAQHGRGATPSTKAPAPPRAKTSRTEIRRQSLSGIPAALGSPITLPSTGVPKSQTRSRPVSLLGAPSSGLRAWQTGPKVPSPAPTPTPTKTKRLSTPIGTRGAGSVSKDGNSTNGNLPPTRSPTPREGVKASTTQSTIFGRPSLVQDAVKMLNTSSKPSNVQVKSKQLGTRSAKHSVAQEATGRLAKQTATNASTRTSGKVPARQPTPTTPRRHSVTPETTARPERASAGPTSTGIPAKSATGPPAAAPSGRHSATQERTHDTRGVKDSDHGYSSNRSVSRPNSRGPARIHGKQLQMVIPSSSQSAHVRLPITPISATSTAPPKLPSPLTLAPSKGLSHPPATPAPTTDLTKLPPTPISSTVPSKIPTTPAVVATISTLPPTPALPTAPPKPPDTPASSQTALLRTLSSRQCLEEDSKISPGLQNYSTNTESYLNSETGVDLQPLPSGAGGDTKETKIVETQSFRAPEPKQSKDRETVSNHEVQITSPSDLRAPPNTPIVRTPCNPQENDAEGPSAVPFHPLSSGGLFISGDERRIQRQQTPKRTRSVGYAPPVRILRSPERAPVPLEYPPWDRTVEVTWERTLNNPPDKFIFDKDLSFQQGVLRLRKERALRDPGGTHDTNRKGLQNGKYAQLKGLGRSKACLYFFLPDRARFKITNMILNHLNTGTENPKPVRMNPPRHYEPIWPLHPLHGRKLWTTEYLDSFSSAISPLYRYMSVCYDMRVDFLAAFFLARRFHVVYSPFVAEKNCPAATLLMDAYVPLMRYITLEVDYTKLGGNVHPIAVSVDQWRGLERVRQLVARFTNLQCTRADGVNIGNLCLMVRRYYGFREGMRWKKGSAERRVKHDEPEPKPKSDAEVGASTEPGGNDEDDDEELVPYHPDAYLCVLDPLKMIGHRIDSLIVVGTTRSYANELIYAVWGKDEIPRGPGWKAQIEKHRKYRTAATFPFTPGQRSALTRPGKNGGLQLTRHTRDPRNWMGSYGCKLRPEVKIVESNLVPGRTKYGFHWNEQLGSSPMSGVLTIVKLPSDKHLPKLVMKPVESTQSFSSIILSRAFNRTPRGIRPPPAGPSSPLLNTTSVSATAPGSGSISPPITKPSPLSQITFLGEESADEGQQNGQQSSLHTEAEHPEEDGEDHWKRHIWKPPKIPLGQLIKRHAKSITKKRSSNRLSEAESEQDNQSGAGSEDQKGTFGKLMKRASSSVLGKGFFGKRGMQTHRY
ncbi:hypothetical protein B0T21DRAFT_366171 [Apiosordaria backusii]|uniref:Uncharacterized protein n=1 Tax=Apiosordaria backusii TaxID=314023 RepID=A0AA40BKR0_9PEZI|nr:hypothetical protein B0T21DRAFT_366171 [Apiosordaria backusii]